MEKKEMDDNIFDGIVELIHDIEPSLKVSLEASMSDDLGLDSVDRISFFFELETAFNITIPDSDISENSLDMIADIVKYVKRKISET